MDSLFLLTQNSGKILGPIAKVLGYLMNAIYAFMDNFLNIQNVGLTIIAYFRLPISSRSSQRCHRS